VTIACCPLYGDYDERAAFSSKETRRAAKAYVCCECEAPIPKGERHELYSGKWDGDFSAFRTCLSCVEIRDHFACSSGWTFTQVWDDIKSNFFPTMTAGGPCMEGLSPAAKARLFELRLAWIEEVGADEAARLRKVREQLAERRRQEAADRLARRTSTLMNTDGKEPS
jgi:hypothetical protein